jgi:hypothetical protein
VQSGPAALRRRRSPAARAWRLAWPPPTAMPPCAPNALHRCPTPPRTSQTPHFPTHTEPKAEEEPQPINIVLAPKGPALRLREAWMAECAGDTILRAGLSGAVCWASQEVKSLSGSVPFKLQASAWAQGGGCRAILFGSTFQGPSQSSCRPDPTCTTTLCPACASPDAARPSAPPPVPLEQVPDFTDRAVRAAISCARATAAATKPGPDYASFVADTLGPHPAAVPVLRYGLPATWGGLPPVLARLTVGIVPLPPSLARVGPGDAAGAKAAGMGKKERDGGDGAPPATPRKGRRSKGGSRGGSAAGDAKGGADKATPEKGTPGEVGAAAEGDAKGEKGKGAGGGRAVAVLATVQFAVPAEFAYKTRGEAPRGGGFQGGSGSRERARVASGAGLAVGGLLGGPSCPAPPRALPEPHS